MWTQPVSLCYCAHSGSRLCILICDPKPPFWQGWDLKQQREGREALCSHTQGSGLWQHSNTKHGGPGASPPSHAAYSQEHPRKQAHCLVFGNSAVSAGSPERKVKKPTLPFGQQHLGRPLTRMNPGLPAHMLILLYCDTRPVPKPLSPGVICSRRPVEWHCLANCRAPTEKLNTGSKLAVCFTGTSGRLRRTYKMP